MAFAVRRTAWLSPILLLAAVLLVGSLAFAIANLDRGEETLPDFPVVVGGAPGSVPFGPTGEQLTWIWRVVIASIFALAAAGVIVALWRREKVVSPWELLGYAFGIGLVGGLILLWPLIVDGLAALFTPGGSTTPTPGTGGGVPEIPTSTALPVAAIAFAAILLAVYLFAGSSRLLPALADLARAREPERERRRYEAARAVRRTLLELEAGTDFRTAVLACYQRMCALLLTRGVPRQEALTPREIEGLALSGLGLSQGSVDDLTGLFEEARYSDHEIGALQRDRAVECLTQIRRELEG